ncbi:O-antigen ligase family protein [Prochlorococcus sp. AH-716-K03]|nr:O-antigen ligase family protein [Prochlorococcus sp. AH-716-K03]
MYNYIEIRETLQKGSIKLIRKIYSNLAYNLFLAGIFLLPSAPFFSILLLIYPLLNGLRINLKNIMGDKVNLLLLAAGASMIIKSLVTTINLSEPLNGWNPNLNWIGLGNYIPLFFVYFGLQPYVSNNVEREKLGKFLLLGTIPVIFSCFSQYFLRWYGPYEFLDGLIIWFQRPLNQANQPVSGLFNNPNYTGAWLAMIWPFSLALLSHFKNNKKALSYILIFSFCISIVFTLNLVNSRGAWLGLLLSIPIIYGGEILIWFIPLILLLSLYLLFCIIPNVPLDLQNYLRSMIPQNILENFKDLEMSYENWPRLLIWKNSIELIFKKPLFGWGAASFPLIYLSQTGDWKGHPHNLFLELSLSYGLIPSILLLLFTLIILQNSYNYIYKYQYQINKFNRACWASSFVFLILQLFDIVYFDFRISIIFWILLAGIRNIFDEQKNLVFIND